MCEVISIDPRDHFSKEGLRADLLSSLTGQRLTHFMYGDGVILSAGSDLILGVRFDCAVKGRTDRQFVGTCLLDGKIKRITVPHAVLEALREARRAEADRLNARRAAQAADDEFAALKNRYGVKSQQETDSKSPLYPMLRRIAEGKSLNEEDAEWLIAHRIDILVAVHYELCFKERGDLWMLVKASSAWRRAGLPQNAIRATQGGLTGESVVLAALNTTRGGAFRDLGHVSEAEECANRAIALNSKSFHPYNLLGAICYQCGRFIDGDKCFARAMALGSSSKAQETVIRLAVQDASPLIGRTLAQHLLRRDPEAFGWASRYAGDPLGDF